MTKNVWHKRYHGDALNGCMGLSLEERGAYNTLLDLMYDTDWDVGIPDRERWLAGHLNVSVRKWQKLRADLIYARKIDIVDGMISNPRYRKEREFALETSRKRAESGASGGRKSGEVRAKAAENRGHGEASASDLPLYACALEAEAEIEKKDNASALSSAGTREELDLGVDEKPPPKGKSSGRSKRAATSLPEDWMPVLTDGARAIIAGWPTGLYEQQIENFKNHAIANNRKAVDWQAAFRTWIGKTQERRIENGSRGQTAGGGSSGNYRNGGNRGGGNSAADVYIRRAFEARHRENSAAADGRDDREIGGSGSGFDPAPRALPGK